MAGSSPRIFKKLHVNGKTIVIREPKDPGEYRKLMDVQIEIWGMPGYVEAVTYHVMISVHRNGGIVIGAFEEDTGKPIGLVFSIPAYKNGMVYMYSHVAGVIPEYRYKGIGYEMKLIQRNIALEKGYNLITWTYDPMQGANAYFNIEKLGVIVRRFYEDYYGELEDEINRGMPSDRFMAEWWIRSNRVELKLKGELKTPHVSKLLDLGGILVNTVRFDKGIPRMIEYEKTTSSDMVLIEVPGDMSLVRKNRDILLEWRIKLRELFNYYLNEMGYIVVGLSSTIDRDIGVRRNYYVLWRRNIEKVLEGDVPWS